MSSVKLAVMSSFCFTAIASHAHAVNRLVPETYPTIQSAINAAQHGDTVLVANGVYSGAGNRELNLMGKKITLRSVNGPADTVIDIQGTPQVWHIGFNLHSQETSETIIQGFTIRNGYAFDGAAIHLVNSSPTIIDCIFTQNHAVCWGAAMYFDGNASPIVKDCKFTMNSCDADGGAVFGFNGAPTFTNCLFANNSAANSSGAILSWGTGSAPKLINSTVVGNSAGWGSAIYSNNLQIVNSIIWGNTGAPDQIYEFGGGTLTVEHSIVEGGFEGEAVLDIAPLFVDAMNGDFHLAANSPGIDAGTPGMKPIPGDLDLDGDPRIFGPAIDIGFDEFRKSGDVTGDHAVNVDDLLEVVNNWGPCSWSMADLTGNFVVNVDDLLMVINHWE